MNATHDTVCVRSFRSIKGLLTRALIAAVLMQGFWVNAHEAPVSSLEQSAETSGASAKAHVHGQAKMQLILMGTELSVSLDVPLMDVVGFERLPATDKERNALQEAMDYLEQPTQWLVFDKALCQLQRVTLDRRLLNASSAQEHPHHHFSHHHDHEEHDDAHEEHDDAHEGHFDITADYLWSCVNGQPQQVRVNLFKRFSALERVTLEWLTDKDAGRVELTAGQPLLQLPVGNKP